MERLDQVRIVEANPLPGFDSLHQTLDTSWRHFTHAHKEGVNLGLLEPGEFIEQRYQVQKRLGESEVGGAYLAVDLQFGASLVVLKPLDLETVPSEQVLALKQHLQAEALVLRTLQHPRLPRIQGYFESPGQFILVRDFVVGCPLSEVACSPLWPTTVFDYAIQIATTLVYLHRQQPYPIFLKAFAPDKILVTERGCVLTEFGRAGTSLPLDEALRIRRLGTCGEAYIAPELHLGADADPQTDVYSLGALLYFLLTGQAPEKAALRQHALATGASDPLRLPSQVRPGIPFVLDDMVAQMMALQPARRPSGAEQALSLLQQIATSGTQASSDAPSGDYSQPSEQPLDSPENSAAYALQGHLGQMQGQQGEQSSASTGSSSPPQWNGVGGSGAPVASTWWLPSGASSLGDVPSGGSLTPGAQTSRILMTLCYLIAFFDAIRAADFGIQTLVHGGPPLTKSLDFLFEAGLYCVWARMLQVLAREGLGLRDVFLGILNVSKATANSTPPRDEHGASGQELRSDVDF